MKKTTDNTTEIRTETVTASVPTLPTVAGLGPMYELPAVRGQLWGLAEPDVVHYAEAGEVLFYLTGYQVTRGAWEESRGYEGHRSNCDGIKPKNTESERYPANGSRYTSNHQHPAGSLVTAGLLVGANNTETAESEAFICNLLATERLVPVGFIAEDGGMRFTFRYSCAGIDAMAGTAFTAHNAIITQYAENGARLPADGRLYLTRPGFNMYIHNSPTQQVFPGMLISETMLDPSSVPGYVERGELVEVGAISRAGNEVSINDTGMAFYRDAAVIAFDAQMNSRRDLRKTR